MSKPDMTNPEIKLPAMRHQAMLHIIEDTFASWDRVTSAFDQANNGAEKQAVLLGVSDAVTFFIMNSELDELGRWLPSINSRQLTRFALQVGLGEAANQLLLRRPLEQFAALATKTVQDEAWESLIDPLWKASKPLLNIIALTEPTSERSKLAATTRDMLGRCASRPA